MSITELADAILAGKTVGMLDEAETVMVLGEIQDRCRKAPSSAGETGKLTADLASATQRAEKAESELAKLRTENSTLKVKDAEFESRVHLEAAKQLCAVGIRPFVPSAAAPTAKPPTITEVCRAAKAAGLADFPIPSPVAATAPVASHISDDEE